MASIAYSFFHLSPSSHYVFSLLLRVELFTVTHNATTQTRGLFGETGFIHFHGYYIPELFRGRPKKWNTLGRLEATNLSFIHTLSHLYILILIHTSKHFTETIALKPIVWKPLNAHALYCRIYRAVVFDDYRGTYRMFWYICECDFWEIKSGNGWRFRFCAFCE